MTMHLLRSKPLPHDDAQALLDEGDELFGEKCVALSLVEVDEERALWSLEILGLTLSSLDFSIFLGALGLSLDFFEPVDLSSEVDWVLESLKGLHPVCAGRFFLHGSHDRGKRPPSCFSLEIDAITAFGSGHHPTTQGCLRALDHLLKERRPQRILDVGCGTGVLALAAKAAYPGAFVIASDCDPEAVRITLENARKNTLPIRGVQAFGTSHPLIRHDAPYDLIFANILARPLISLAQDLGSHLARKGSLILSGLTVQQERWVLSPFLMQKGMVLERILRLKTWSTLVLRKS